MDNNFVRRFIVGVSSTSVGTVCQVLSGFLCLMVTARLISKQEFGYYVIMLVISSMFAMLSSLLLDFVAVTKVISTAEEPEKTKYVNAAVSFKLAIDLSLCLLILLAKPILENFINFTGLTWWPVYVSILFFLGNVNQLFVRILQGLHRYKEIAISQAVNAVIRIATVFLFLYFLKMDIKGVILSTICSYLITSIYQFAAIPYPMRIRFERDLFTQMLRFGFPLGLNNIMSFVFNKVDRFMLGCMQTPVHVAYYEIASKLPDCGRTLYDAYQTVFFPSMAELCSRNNHEDAGKILNNSIRLLSFFSLLATFVMYLFQYEIVEALFSKRYLPSSPAVPLLMLVLCLDLTGNILGTTLVAYGQSDKPVKINVFGAATTIISNLVLIPLLGFIGAAYASILSRIVTNPMNVWCLKKQGLHVDVSQYLKPILAFGICYVMTMVVSANNLYLKLSYIVLFIVVNLLLSVIKSEDVHFIRNGLREIHNVGT